MCSWIMKKYFEVKQMIFWDGHSISDLNVSYQVALNMLYTHVKKLRTTIADVQLSIEFVNNIFQSLRL